jgi:hypothetical protein
MAERWIGPGQPGGGGAGSRLFDILVNGVALQRDFDLFRRAAARMVPLQKLPSKQIQRFMTFTKCLFQGFSITLCRPENGSKTNFATKPEKSN